MNQTDQVAKYVRDMGRETSRPCHVEEIMAELGFTRDKVSTARTVLARECDDIFPVGPLQMLYKPGWKEEYPEVWEKCQERSRAVADGQRRAREARASGTSQPKKEKRRSQLPNVMGPFITLHNVVAINVHQDHVSVQHDDGSWTELTGTLKMRDTHHG